MAVWFHSPQKAKKYSNPGDIETLPTPPGPGCAERANGCGTFGAAWNRVRSTQFVALLVQLNERRPGLGAEKLGDEPHPDPWPETPGIVNDSETWFGTGTKVKNAQIPDTVSPVTTTRKIGPVSHLRMTSRREGRRGRVGRIVRPQNAPASYRRNPEFP